MSLGSREQVLGLNLYCPPLAHVLSAWSLAYGAILKAVTPLGG